MLVRKFGLTPKETNLGIACESRRINFRLEFLRLLSQANLGMPQALFDRRDRYLDS